MTRNLPSDYRDGGDSRAAWVSAIEALGEAEFPEMFGRTLASIAPVSLFSVFRLDAEARIHFLFAGAQLEGDREFAQIASTRYAAGYWKSDPVMRSVLADGERSIQIRSQAWDAIPPSEYRTFCYERMQVTERVLICRRVASEMVLVGLYRTGSEGCFKPSHAQRIAEGADMLATMAWKHSWVAAHCTSPRLHPDDASVARHLAARHLELSSREVEVCTGLLLGKPTKEIARSLGIKPSSVITFRKRAFLKLNIATHHDLVRLYEHSLAA
jgi:DNA-binding CsgD family transcriptional regulator